MELRLSCTNPAMYTIQTLEGLNLRYIFTCCIVKVKLSRSVFWSIALMKIFRNMRNWIRVKWEMKCGGGLGWRPPLYKHTNHHNHYNDVIMGSMASQITSLTIVYSTVYSGADQRKHQSSASLAFVWGIHRRPVNSPHTWLITQKMFPFDEVIMIHR